MKDKEKEIQSILNEYTSMRRKKEEDTEDLQDKSVINPELTLEQIKNLKEKDLNMQVMRALIKKQDEIQKDIKKINEKIKKIKTNIGNFRYEYDSNGNATNSDEMQKMTQKYEKAKKELAKIKKVKALYEENLSDFENKTGFTTDKVKEMMKEEEQKRIEYEKQEEIRKQKLEEERIEQEKAQKALEESLRKAEEDKKNNIENEITQESNTITEEIQKYKINEKDIITIFPYQNKVSYIFDGKEGHIDNIRDIVWEGKPKIFRKYKIKKEEYILTNEKTGESKEFSSKLNPIIFEILKSNSEKLENYIELNSKIPILYVFDEKQKENKDVAKIMYKYQKKDKDITQKIGYISIKDKINSRFSYKLGKKQLALPEGEKNIEEETTNYETSRNRMLKFRKGIAQKAKQYDQAIEKIDKIQKLNSSKSENANTDSI